MPISPAVREERTRRSAEERARREVEEAAPPADTPEAVKAQERFVQERLTPTEPDLPGGQTAMVDGQRRYVRGSTMYEKGFRTEKEYQQAQTRGATLGTHEGKDIPEDTLVITTKKGRPYARYTQKQIEGKIDPEFLRPYIEQGRYKIPAKDYRGNRILLSAEDAKALSQATGKDQFEVAKRLRLVPKGSKYVQGEEGKWGYMLKSGKRVRESKLPKTPSSQKKVTRARLISPVLRKAAKRQEPKLKPDTAMARRMAAEGMQWQQFKTIQDYNRFVTGLNKKSKSLEQELKAINMGKIDGWNKRAETLLSEADRLEKRHQSVDPTNSYDVTSYNNAVKRYNLKLAALLKDRPGLDVELRKIKSYNSKAETLNRMTRRTLLPSIPKKAPMTTQRAINEISSTMVSQKPPTKRDIKNVIAKLKTEEEKKAFAAWLKRAPVEVAELIVPGVYVARNWARLSTAEKVANIAIDVASVLLFVGIFKATGAAMRAISGVTKAEALAVAAGKASRKLNAATKVLDKSMKLKAVGRKKLTIVQKQRRIVNATNKVEKAQRASMRADRLFLENLESLSEITVGQLKQLEKASGLRGLRRAIQDITKAQKRLSKSWANVERLEKLHKKHPDNAGYTRLYEQALSGVYDKKNRVLQKGLLHYQRELEAALARAGSTLKPRYSMPPQPAQFKGYGVGWQKSGPQPKIKPDKGTLGAIESYLARSREVRRTGTEAWVAQKAVKTITKSTVELKGKHRLKLKPIYAKPKAAPKPKPKAAPEVKKRPFGLEPKKKAVEAAEKTIPLEAAGRWTAAKIAEEYGEEIDAFSKAITIDELLKGIKHKDKFYFVPDRKVKLVVIAGTQALVNAIVANKSIADQRSAIRESIQAAIRQYMKPMPRAAVVAQPATKTLTKTTTKMATIIPTKIKIPPPKKLITLKLPGGKPTTEWTEEQIKSAVAWKMGVVIYAIKSPYSSKADIKVWPVDEAPSGLRLISIHKGKGSASRSYIPLKGKPPKSQKQLDIGITDALFSSKGLRFRADPGMKTVGDMSVSNLSNLSRRRGRMFETRVKGGKILSRRPIRGTRR